MVNLNIGQDVVAIKDAVRQVQRNIRELREKKSQIQLPGEGATTILKFYDDKIAAQKITLLWLQRSSEWLTTWLGDRLHKVMSPPT